MEWGKPEHGFGIDAQEEGRVSAPDAARALSGCSVLVVPGIVGTLPGI
jgi:hypothetical protein